MGRPAGGAAAEHGHTVLLRVGAALPHEEGRTTVLGYKNKARLRDPLDAGAISGNLIFIFSSTNWAHSSRQIFFTSVILEIRRVSRT